MTIVKKEELDKIINKLDYTLESSNAFLKEHGCDNLDKQLSEARLEAIKIQNAGGLK